MNSLQPVIQIIQNVEQQFDIDKLTYKGINVWPLYRLKLWTELTHRIYDSRTENVAQKEIPSKPNGLQKPFVPIEIFPHSTGPLFVADQSEVRKIVFQPDILAFTRPEEHNENYHGLSYAKTIDSLIELIEPEFQFQKIELLNPTNRYTSRKHPPIYLNQKIWEKSLRSNFPETLAVPAKLSEKLVGLDIKISARSIIGELELILNLAALYIEALELFSPRAVILSCYYGLSSMAMCLACRQRNIPIYDLQHGRLGPYHGMYTDFSFRPKSGYQLLPDAVLCWGQRTVDDIGRQTGTSEPAFKAICVGNAWVSKWAGGNEFLIPGKADDELKSLVRGRKIVLVTLQPIKHPIPNCLIDAMLFTSDKCFWLIRCHPGWVGNISGISDLLKEKNISNGEVNLASNTPLYWLLARAHHHVTLFSSTALEALYFRVPTTLIDPIGESVFRNFVDDNSFNVAYDGKILAQLVQAERQVTKLDTRFIVDDQQEIFDNFCQTIYGDHSTV
jgi:hypothetical protein